MFQLGRRGTLRISLQEQLQPSEWGWIPRAARNFIFAKRKFQKAEDYVKLILMFGDGWSADGISTASKKWHGTSLKFERADVTNGGFWVCREIELLEEMRDYNLKFCIKPSSSDFFLEYLLF